MKISETLPESGYLIVPMDIEAMCIGHESDSDNTFATDPYQFNLLTHQDVIPLSKHIHKAANSAMEKGIYIHWALPDGLTHAVEDEGSFIFPAVPNRWLVTRLIEGEILNHWVVESDYLSDENELTKKSTQSVPYKMEDKSKAFKYLGRVLPLEEWKEKKNTDAGLAYPDLNATGYGIPEFAASYQHSKGVFSFYDADVQQQANDISISYFVVGWYEQYDREHPILGTGADGTEKIKEILNRYHWCLPKDTILSDKVVHQLYCSGSISGINWNASKQYLNDLHYPEISISVGHNENEALSALISGLSDGGKESELLLNALQMGVLEDLIEPDSINMLHDLYTKINDATFQNIESGTCWQIEPENINSSEKADYWKSDAVLQMPELSLKLNELNRLQKKTEDFEQQIIAFNQQLYLYWTATLKPNTNYQAKLRWYLKEQLSLLYEKKKEDVSDEINILKKEIENLLKETGKSGYIFVLKEYPKARYYQPLEPVVLFQGAKISAPQRYGGDGSYMPDKTLVCRLNDQLISKVNEITVPDDFLFIDFSQVPKEIIHDLLLVNPYYLEKKENAGSISDYKKTVESFVSPELLQVSHPAAISLKQLKKQDLDTKETFYVAVSRTDRTIGRLTFNNVSPSPVGINFWDKNPWLPLYFKYDVSYYPVNSKKETNFDRDFITDLFELEHTSDKLLAKNYNIFSKDAVQYQNVCLLSQHSKVNLQEKIKDFIDKHPDQILSEGPLVRLLEASRELPDLLSQSLFGLNDALVGLKNTLQLPVINYDENMILKELAESVHKNTGGSNGYELDDGVNYHPLSAGLLKINTLTIVDAFGRHIDVPKNKQYRAGSLTVSDTTITNLYLAPRLVSPAKLTASWLDQHGHPVNGLPVSNPISGWLMPNFIDHSIWLFTAEGNPAGELSIADGWKKTPGSVYDCYEEVKNKNTGFTKVLTYLEKSGNIAVFLENSRNTLQNNQPENHRSLNAGVLFFGVPLAVANIHLAIEIKGSLPVDYSERSIEAELNEAPAGLPEKESKFRHCHEVDKVFVPLLVGNNDHMGDGMMAYCKAGNSDTFYYENEEQTLTINGDPLEICAIFDPRNSIHFHTGILPVKELHMPEYYYAAIVRNMQLAIEVSRLVAASAASCNLIKMPLPSTEGNTWEWWSEDNGDWNAVPAQEEHDDAINEGFNILTQGWLKLKHNT